MNPEQMPALAQPERSSFDFLRNNRVVTMLAAGALFGAMPASSARAQEVSALSAPTLRTELRGYSDTTQTNTANYPFKSMEQIEGDYNAFLQRFPESYVNYGFDGYRPGEGVLRTCSPVVALSNVKLSKKTGQTPKAKIEFTQKNIYHSGAVAFYKPEQMPEHSTPEQRGMSYDVPCDNLVKTEISGEIMSMKPRKGSYIWVSAPNSKKVTASKWTPNVNFKRHHFYNEPNPTVSHSNQVTVPLPKGIKSSSQKGIQKKNYAALVITTSYKKGMEPDKRYNVIKFKEIMVLGAISKGSQKAKVYKVGKNSGGKTRPTSVFEDNILR